MAAHHRRSFLAGSLGMTFASGARQSGAAEGGVAERETSRPLLIEWRSYLLRFGPTEARFAEYAKGALVPALNRAGVKPVGAFGVLFGPHHPTLHLLLPHSSAESVTTLEARLEADAEYRRAAGAFLDLPAGDPPYVSQEASLSAAFDAFPGIEAPAGPAAAPSRVFELRSYASHSPAAGRKKIEMFEAAGEIAIFRRVGLTPVFFGRNVIGPRLPSLTYMLVFPDLAARERNWAAFREDPEWLKLRAAPGFSNAEILANIDVLLLRPAEYSQL
jgi:hypothetical protein